MPVKSVIQSALGFFGLQMTKKESRTLVDILQDLKIDVVLDIGANRGQFASGLIASGYKGRIVCFEPTPDAHAKLEARFSKTSQVTVHPRSAIGAETGTLSFNIAENSVSSSALNATKETLSRAPEVRTLQTLSVPLTTIDEIFDTYVNPNDKCFLKSDTQGYEIEVLDGASSSLTKICGVFLEMALTPTYVGQPKWHDICDRMHKEGYSLWSIFRGFTETGTGRLLEMDGIFVRENKT